MRRTLAVLAAAAAAVLAALILGEYEYVGYVPVAAGLIVGLLVAEVVVSLGRWRAWPAAGLAAVLGAGAVVWGGWITSGQGLEPYPASAWAGAALAAAAAAVRARPIEG